MPVRTLSNMAHVRAPFHGGARLSQIAWARFPSRCSVEPMSRSNTIILLHLLIAAIGPSRHFAATQQSVAFGGKADVAIGHR